MDVVCYLHPSWHPRLRPASNRRDWMEETPYRFAYRCLPLAIANAHGWEIGSPCGFRARWNGGSGAEAVEIELDPGTTGHSVPVSLFGQGTITFHVEGLFRTPPGWNLWVGGPPNMGKDGIAPLAGVIETDWSPYTFTMNWRFTRVGEWVRWAEDEPFCFMFPVQRGVMDGVRPVLRPLADAPELEDAFRRWSLSRDAFQAHVRATNPPATADHWQKLYYRGVGPDGEPGPADHQSKLRVQAFAPPAAPAAAGREAAPERCPVTQRREPAVPPDVPAAMRKPDLPRATGGPLAPDVLRATLRAIGFDPAAARAPAPVQAPPAPAPAPAPPAPSIERTLAQRDWLLATMQRQRALSPRGDGVAREHDLSSDDFLDRYYAAGRPVLIAGAAAGWPAVSRWTPDYLARAVGAAEIQYQGARDGDPDFELAKDRHRRRLPFDRFVAEAVAPGAGNDACLTAYNSAVNRAALAPLAADLGTLDRYLTAGEGMLWIGPGGTFTPLHFDQTNNLLVQLVGRKRLILVPPGETPRMANLRDVFSEVHDLTDPAMIERFPAARDVRRFEVEIAPGDALYIPVGWWHQVAAIEFSVMLTYTNFRWPNDAHERFPAA